MPHILCLRFIRDKLGNPYFKCSEYFALVKL